MDKYVARDTTVDKAIRQGLEKLGIASHEAQITVLSEGKKGLFGFGQKEAVVEVVRREEFSMEEPADIQLTENEERVEDILEDYGDETSEEKGTVQEAGVEAAVEISELPLLGSERYDDEDEEYGDYDESAPSNREEAVRKVTEYLTSIAEVYGAPAKVSVEETPSIITFQMDSEKPGILIGKYGKIINALQVLAQTLFQHYEQRRVSVIVNVGDYRERRKSILENIADRTAEKVLRTKQPVFLEPLPAFERKIIHARLSQNKRITTHSEGKEPHRYLVVEVAE